MDDTIKALFIESNYPRPYLFLNEVATYGIKPKVTEDDILADKKQLLDIEEGLKNSIKENNMQGIKDAEKNLQYIGKILVQDEAGITHDEVVTKKHSMQSIIDEFMLLSKSKLKGLNVNKMFAVFRDKLKSMLPSKILKSNISALRVLNSNTLDSDTLKSLEKLIAAMLKGQLKSSDTSNPTISELQSLIAKEESVEAEVAAEAAVIAELEVESDIDKMLLLKTAQLEELKEEMELLKLKRKAETLEEMELLKLKRKAETLEELELLELTRKAETFEELELEVIGQQVENKINELNGDDDYVEELKKNEDELTHKVKENKKSTYAELIQKIKRDEDVYLKEEVIDRINFQAKLKISIYYILKKLKRLEKLKKENVGNFKTFTLKHNNSIRESALDDFTLLCHSDRLGIKTMLSEDYAQLILVCFKFLYEDLQNPEVFFYDLDRYLVNKNKYSCIRPLIEAGMCDISDKMFQMWLKNSKEIIKQYSLRKNINPPTCVLTVEDIIDKYF